MHDSDLPLGIGEEHFCSICSGTSQRRKAADKSPYHVDCIRCGSYRIGGLTEQMMPRNAQAYRDNAAAMVHDANARGLRYDFMTAQPMARRLHRIDAEDSTSLILVEEPGLGDTLEWRAKHLTGGMVDRDELIEVDVADPTRDEAIALLTGWWRSH